MGQDIHKDIKLEKASDFLFPNGLCLFLQSRINFALFCGSKFDGGDRYLMSEHNEEQTQQVTITLSDVRYA